jgi:hypothetical protein
MSDINPDEPLEEEFVVELDEEVEAKPKSSTIKFLAVMLALIILVGSFAFIVTSVIRGSNDDLVEEFVEGDSDETKQEGDIPAFFFSEDQRWFCLMDTEVVDCESPHNIERHYLHFNSIHGALDENIIDQIKNKEIDSDEFCVAWLSQNIADKEQFDDASDAPVAVTGEEAPTGVFCDLDFTKDQIGLSVKFDVNPPMPKAPKTEENREQE